MEITSTTVTRTAHHKTNGAVYNIEYSETNGRLDRIGLNIFRPPQEGEIQDYYGSVHYDGNAISCNLRWNENLAHLFEAATAFIAEIIESTGNDTAEEIPDNNESR
jgi:hypothetical protein